MEMVKIKKIKKINKRDRYDLEVEDNHNYFANNILVHNCRCIAIKEDNTFNFYSRKGKQFTTLNNIIPELMKATKGIDDIVFDGEICILDNRGNEVFSSIMKEIKKKDHTISKPKYKIFDCLTKDEFYSGTGDRTLDERLDLLNGLVGHNNRFLDVLEQLQFTQDSFAEMKKKVEEFGWEGLMLRKSNVGYQNKRTSDLLKVKSFMDAEYKVLGIETGPFSYTVPGEGQKEEIMMTAVRISHKKNRVSVGSGWAIEERREFFKNPDKIIGKYINVSFFEESKNKNGLYSLRFPVVSYIVGANIRDT
jgi:DNA ligase-1